LITLGVLFALNNFTDYRFDQTWPVLLIVFGLLTLLGRSTEPAPQYPNATYPPPAPGPYSTPGTGATSGGYAQSPYAQPPQGTPKGGFGTTAPPPSPKLDNGPEHGGAL
jgi:hypothetical protein